MAHATAVDPTTVSTATASSIITKCYADVIVSKLWLLATAMTIMTMTMTTTTTAATATTTTTTTTTMTTTATTTIIMAATSPNRKLVGAPSACPDGCNWLPVPTPALVCVKANLTAIPKLNISTYFVDFTGNALDASLGHGTLAPVRIARAYLKTLVLKACAIRSISRDAFDQLDNLRIVDLSNNAIVALESGVFAPLARLTELDLSRNSIGGVAADWFADGAGLRLLNMAANPIGRLDASAFIRFASLEQLLLRGCALRAIDERAFDGLFKLRTLDLGANLLSTLKADAITWLGDLQTIMLDTNPWRCDCDLQAITVVLLMRGFHSLAANLTCATADRGTIRWADANASHPECMSQVRLHARKTLISGLVRRPSKAAPSPTHVVNASRLNATWSFSSHAASAAIAYSSVVTVLTWCAVIVLVAVGSYVGVYLAGRMCVCATTTAAAAAHAASNAATRKKSSIVRRESGSECERALVDETAPFRHHFYLVDEASSSDMSVSLDV